MIPIDVGSQWTFKDGAYDGMILTVRHIDEPFVRLSYTEPDTGEFRTYDIPTATLLERYMPCDAPKPEEEAENPKDRLGLKKPRLALVPPASLVYEALAMQNGAEKYGPYNWREKKVKLMVYLDAALRHIESFVDGEECAEDSGVPHLAHAKACLGIIADAKETGNLEDDRPKAGAVSALIKKYTKGEPK